MAASEALMDEPEFSVLIGRVGTEDGARILEALAALGRQAGAGPYEVIVADRLADATTREIEARFPQVRLLHVPPGTTLPAMRTTALGEARGRYIAVTEDHCIAPPDWLASFARAFAEAPPGTVAIGGAVENGVADTPLDHATFFCEYSAFLAPVAEGPAESLPGMNVAYVRAALGHLDAGDLAAGFWESTAHPALARAGGRLLSTNRVRIVHAKKFRPGFFLRQRFLYSRHFAGTRFRSSHPARRALACAATIVLPGVLLARIVRSVLAKPGARAHLPAAIPWLSLFVITWSLGEMIGYAAGPGGALPRIE